MKRCLISTTLITFLGFYLGYSIVFAVLDPPIVIPDPAPPPPPSLNYKELLRWAKAYENYLDSLRALMRDVANSKVLTPEMKKYMMEIIKHRFAQAQHYHRLLFKTLRAHKGFISSGLLRLGFYTLPVTAPLIAIELQREQDKLDEERRQRWLRETEEARDRLRREAEERRRQESQDPYGLHGMLRNGNR